MRDEKTVDVELHLSGQNRDEVEEAVRAVRDLTAKPAGALSAPAPVPPAAVPDPADLPAPALTWLKEREG